MYGVVISIKLDSGRESTKDITQAAKYIIESSGGKVLRVENWVKKSSRYQDDPHFLTRLSDHPLMKDPAMKELLMKTLEKHDSEPDRHYSLIKFFAEPSILAELRESLELNKEIFEFQTVNTLEPFVWNGASHFLSLFYGPPDEALSVYDGGETPDSALDRAREGGSRNYSFTLERLFISEVTWPFSEPETALSYIIRKNHFVVLVPSISLYHSVSCPPLNLPSFVRIAFVSSDENEARMFIEKLGIRSLLGKVHSVVYCDTGGEIGGIQKEDKKLWAGW